MYEAHAAIEDTIVFPAWKKVLSPRELDQMGDRFEDIEHRTFGKDGFDDAVGEVAAIEKRLGSDLAAMTAPPPPLEHLSGEGVVIRRRTRRPASKCL
jgi:hypothetical protein